MQKPRKLLKYSAWTIVALLLLAIIFRLALGPLSIAALDHWFEQQGLRSEVTDISFDLGNGHLILSGLRASAAGKPVLQLRLARIDWSWSALLDSQLRINSIALDGLEFDVEQGPGDRLVIAGINLQTLMAQPVAATPAPAEASEPPAWKLALGDFALNEFKLCYRAPPRHEYCNRWQKFSWNGEVSLDLARVDANALPLLARGDLRLTRQSLEDRALERDLFGFDNLSISGIAVDNLDNISARLIAFDNFSLLERAVEPGQPQISFIRKFEVAGLKLEQQSHLDIGEIRLLDHQVVMLKRADGGLEVQDWIRSIASGESAATAEAGTAPAQPFSFAIARVSYETSKSIQYRDLSLASPFEANLNTIEIEIDNLDSRKPEQFSHLRYAAKYANHGTMKLEGDITPLAGKRSFDLVGRIEGLDLRALSPLTAAAVGHNIKSGQLDADLKLKAKDNILDSEIDLVLYHFKFSALSAADKEKVDANFGFPLNSTLALMKDREDRIELNVPLTGDLLDPDISPRDAIRQAVATAITTAILNYYTPFGLVNLADGVFNLATALKFEPVIFAQGSGDIGTADIGGLDKLVTLMQEKPGVHLTLCPYTNTADRIQLFAETAAIEPQEYKPDATQQEQLDRLGEARSAAVKNHLVDQKIDPSRLVLCAPEHVEDVVQTAASKDGDGVAAVSKAGIAGVEISI